MNGIQRSVSGILGIEIIRICFNIDVKMGE